MKSYEVKAIFFLKDKGQVIVHLTGVAWDVQNFGTANLCYGEKLFSLSNIGVGNVKGDVALLMTLDDPRFHSLSELEAELKGYEGKLFLEI
jgi:hypothetical protein